MAQRRRLYLHEAIAHMDATLLRFGYEPFRTQTEDGVTVRQYRTRAPGRTNSVSIGLSHDHLKLRGWLGYVDAKIESVLCTFPPTRTMVTR